MSVERDGEWFGGAVEVSGQGGGARRDVVTERCFADAWKCVEQDDSVYPSIRSSRGGGAKRGRAWLKTVNVTLALGSDRFMMGGRRRNCVSLSLRHLRSLSRESSIVPAAGAVDEVNLVWYDSHCWLSQVY